LDSERVLRATVSTGLKREYVRVVEAYRDRAGKTQHRTVLNLGRKNLLAAQLDLTKLRRLLHGQERSVIRSNARRWVRSAHGIGAPMLAAHAMWHELGLDTMLDKHAGRARRDAAGLSDRALVLVTNRLVSPGNERALAHWLETDFVCDRRGRRFIAAWRTPNARAAALRVRVKAQQLQQWYRTLDHLLEAKETVELALFFRLRDLFSLQVDMVFYDLTSTYFEGAGPPELGANEHSRDGKARPRAHQARRATAANQEGADQSA
jgi:hypothetical protein